MNCMTRSTVLFCLAMMVMAFTASPAMAGPPTATISGTTYVYITAYIPQPAYWSVSISGGVPPYTIQWKFNGGNGYNGYNVTTWGGTYLGNNADYHYYDTVSVVVKDSINQVATDSISVEIVGVHDPCAQEPDPFNPWPTYPEPIGTC